MADGSRKEYPRVSASDFNTFFYDLLALRRGKTLGGSTSINGAAWTRGSQAQYDALSQLQETSDASMNWNFNSLFSYMLKVCIYHI